MQWGALYLGALVCLGAVSAQLVLPLNSNLEKRGGSSCPLSVELPEGPFYLNYSIVRSQIVEDRVGVPLQLTIKVVDAATCRPLQNAAVEVWQADANGLYSGWSESVVERDALPEDNGTFLRGVQVIQNTTAGALFNTIVPGWIQGRSVHINTKVHLGGTITNPNWNAYVSSGAGTYGGGFVAHTGQFFVPDEVMNTISGEYQPYDTRPTTYTPLVQDPFYNAQTTTVLALYDVNGLSALDSQVDLSGGLFASVTLSVNSTSPAVPVTGTSSDTSSKPGHDDDDNENGWFVPFLIGLLMGGMLGTVGMFHYIKRNPSFMERHLTHGHFAARPSLQERRGDVQAKVSAAQGGQSPAKTSRSPAHAPLLERDVRTASPEQRPASPSVAALLSKSSPSRSTSPVRSDARTH